MFIISSTLVLGQENESHTITSFGLKAGGNYSVFNISNPSNSHLKITSIKGRTAYHFGGFCTFSISRTLQLATNLLYSAQGGKAHLDIGPYSGGDYEVVLNYLKVPLLLNYEVRNRFYFEAGPEISFLLSHQIKNNGGVGLGSRDNKRSFKKDDLSVVAGVSYCIKPKLGVNFRFSYGLKNINVQDEYSSYRVGEWYNRTLQISAFYSLKK